MNSLTRRIALAVVTIIAAGAGRVEAGPLDPLYLTNGDNGIAFIVQGNTVTPFSEHHQGGNGQNEYAIAVSGGTVRTLHNGNDQGSSSNLGSQYNLSGAYTGVDYPGPGTVHGYYDGTTDGTHNYGANFFTGNVEQLSLSWQSPVVLFHAISNVLGISYDASNNSIWAAQYNSHTLTDYSLGGTVLSSFTTGVSIGFVAVDPSDGSIWVGGISQGTLDQYSNTGTLLSAPNYAALSGQNILGGEFSEGNANPPVGTPEPSTLVAAGLGLLFGGLALRRRRQIA